MADTILPVVTRKRAQEQGLLHYFTGVPCKYGHIAQRTVGSSNCIECLRERAQRVDIRAKACAAAKARAARETPEEREARLQKKRELHYAKRDELLAAMRIRNKAYYQKNKERIKAQTLEYQRKNSHKRTSYKQAWAEQRAKEDPAFAMKLRMRKMLARMYEAIRQKRVRRCTTEQEIGYTAQQLKEHIERQFVRGMSWGNHGEWHIDHIVPIGEFDLLTPEGRRAANALTNLRPIWATENLKKSDKVLTLL